MDSTTAPGGDEQPVSNDADCSNVSCPSCGASFAVEAIALVPQSQKMKVTLHSESQFIAAKSLGGVITANAALLKAVARDIGTKVEVFVCGIERRDNAIEIEFLITTIA